MSNQINLVPRFLGLSLANIASNLMIPLSGSVSLFFLGHLSRIEDLAGPSFAIVLFDFIYYGFYFLRQSTTGMTAQAMGREDSPEMVLIGLRNICIALIVGLLLLISQHPIREIAFALLNASPTIKDAAILYFNARIVGAPAVLINYVLIGWLLGREESGKVLMLSLVGNITNIILDYYLITQWGLGARGAGFAMALSQYTILLIASIIFVHHVWGQDLQAIASRAFDASALGSSLSLNANIFISTLIMILVTDVFSVESSTMGTIIFSQNTLILQIIFLALYAVEGLGLATETLVGYFIGQRMTQLLPNLLALSVISGLIFGLLFGLVPAILPETVFGLFTDHPEITNEINIYIWWLPLFLLFGSVALVLEGYFLGMASGEILRNVNLIAVLVGFFPLGVSAWRFHDNHLLWLAYTMFMLIRMVLFGINTVRTFSVPLAQDAS